jgi:hypothetical protein
VSGADESGLAGDDTFDRTADFVLDLSGLSAAKMPLPNAVDKTKAGPTIQRPRW